MKRKNKLKFWNRVKINTEPSIEAAQGQLITCPTEMLRLVDMELDQADNLQSLSPYRRAFASQEHTLKPWVDSNVWLNTDKVSRSSTISSPAAKHHTRNSTYTKGFTNNTSLHQSTQIPTLNPDELRKKIYSYRRLLAIRQQAKSNYFEFPCVNGLSNSLQERRNTISTMINLTPLRNRLSKLQTRMPKSKFQKLEQVLLL